MSVYQNKMLIANHSLQDTCFRQAVIFVLDDDKSRGTMGLVVNRRIKAKDLCSCGKCQPLPFDIFSGGPCESGEANVILHGIDRYGKEKRKIMDGLWSCTMKTLNRIVDELPKDDHRFKAVSGYSGWAPGQLDREVKNGFWIVKDATPEDVLDGDPDLLWEELVPVQENKA